MRQDVILLTKIDLMSSVAPDEEQQYPTNYILENIHQRVKKSLIGTVGFSQ